MSVVRMDSSSVTPVTSNSLDNSLRIVVHPTPSVDLATIVESTSNGKKNYQTHYYETFNNFVFFFTIF